MARIQVRSSTQRIVVDSSKQVSVISAGPPGPTGMPGPPGPIGGALPDASTQPDGLFLTTQGGVIAYRDPITADELGAMETLIYDPSGKAMNVYDASGLEGVIDAGTF